MSVRLLILGLLDQGPLHGYEIKGILEKDMGDWAKVSVGSIYFALDTLARETLIAAKGTSREGGRPARTVYEITEAGQVEFDRLLRDTWSEIERQRFSLDIGLAFMDSLPKEELRAMLQSRVSALEGILEGLAAHEGETVANPEVPAHAKYIFSHHAVHYRAELEWSKEVLASIG
jgi:DNA-binding PadR family transcriptional regulator